MNKQNIIIRFISASINFVTDVFQIITKYEILALARRLLESGFSLLNILFNVLFLDDHRKDQSNSSSVHGATEEELFSIDLEQTSKSINTHYRWWDR